MQASRSAFSDRGARFAASIAAGMVMLAGPAMAVEGGTGAYLLGARDLMAGFVPPPGSYVSLDFIYITGETSGSIPVNGEIVSQPEVDAKVLKLNATQVFEGQVMGGSFGLTFNLPVVKADLSADTTVAGTVYGFTDDQFGFGDLAVTPMIGWHEGNLHFNAALSFYLPTGQYSPAVVKPLQDVFDILSISKNKFAVDPTVSVTYLNPANGFELSGAFGVTISATNGATDYWTAPEAHLEMTAAQHLPNGFTFGLTSYAYQQLMNDGGSGAESFQSAIGAKSLQARVFGAGPILSYNGKIGQLPVSLEAKYVKEFGARRRLESDVYWLTLGAAF